VPAVPGSQVPPEIQDSNLPGRQSQRPKDRGRVLAAAAATYKVHTDSRRPEDKARSHCNLEAAERTWVERSYSPDTTGTAGSPGKKADTLPSEVDIPDLAPVPAVMTAARETLLEKVGSPDFVLVPGIPERGDKVHLQAETVGPLMDEKAMRPSHALDG
jgi:hypothetical protein